MRQVTAVWVVLLLACLGVNALVLYWLVRLIQAGVTYLQTH